MEPILSSIEKKNRMVAEIMERRHFWMGMLEREFKDQQSPFAIWQTIKLCHKGDIEFPSWVKEELSRIAIEIIRLKKVQTNNYGEFLTDLLNLSGNQIKTARHNQKTISYALKLQGEIDTRKKSLIIDDLINIEELSENQAKEIYKTAKVFSKMFSEFPPGLPSDEDGGGKF